VRPADPIAAVTHADPYPYYAELVAQHPLHRDDRLGLWVASSAAAVTAVLTHDACHVRPRAEPVPAAIAGSPAGDIFGRLVRMNDGARHARLKAAVSATLGALDAARVAAASQACARALVTELAPHASRRGLDDFTVRLAPSVVATLLGVSPAAVPGIVRLTGEFVGALAPGAAPVTVERGALAAGRLLGVGRALASADGLVAALARDSRASDADTVVANALGFLSQAYDATAGLIGGTLLALAHHPGLRDGGLLPRVVTEAARHDAPVQNTRRYVAEDTVVAGQPMKAGDVVLVVLAAANRDPAANTEPGRFDVDRAEPRTFTFGLGAHACPAAVLATTIACAGVSALLAAGCALDGLPAGVRYRPSVNARIPIFDAP
jgi:cytochrome P450